MPRRHDAAIGLQDDRRCEIMAARTETGRHETLAATECGIQCPIQVQARYKKAPGSSGRAHKIAGPADHYDLAVALQHDTLRTVILVGENIHNRNAVLAESVVGRAVRHVAHHRDILIAIPSGNAHNDDLVVELDGEVVGPIEPLGFAQIRDDQPIAAESEIRVPARGLGRPAQAEKYGKNPRLSLTSRRSQAGGKGMQERRYARPRSRGELPDHKTASLATVPMARRP